MRHPWEAFLLIAVEGAGSAGFWPAQSTLIARLAPADRLHAAYAQQRLTMNLGIGLGGVTGGLIAHVAHPGSFTVLFELDALTFLVYVGVLGFVADPAPMAAALPERTAQLVSQPSSSHRTFLGLWSLNFLFVAAGYSLLNLLPQFARDHSHVSEREIGLIFAVNTFMIVIVQLPASRWIEGRRRLRALALMPAALGTSPGCSSTVLAPGRRGTDAFVAVRGRRSDLRRRRVPARPRAPGAGREHRAGHAARTLLRRPLRLLGARRNGRACGRRLRARRRTRSRSGRWPQASVRIAALGSLALERFVPSELRRVPHSTLGARDS